MLSLQIILLTWQREESLLKNSLLFGGMGRAHLANKTKSTMARS